MATLYLDIERPGQQQTRRTFDTDEVVLGRSEDADVPLMDHSVSRRHARISRRGDAWEVEDLGSRNGTLLNGHRIGGPTTIHAGDAVVVGDTKLTMTAPDHTFRVAPAAADGVPMGESVLSLLKPAAEIMDIEATAAGDSSRLRLLNEVHRALARPISRSQLLDIILDRAFETLKPEDAAIFLRGADGELYQAAERRTATSTGRLLVSRRLADEVTVKGAAALVLDAQVDERFSGAESILVSGVRSIVAAPLLDAEGCLGMIALYSRGHVRRFAEQDLDLLVSLAAAAALRVRNLALVEEAANRQLLERELALARDIQTGMITRRVPERAEVDLGAQIRAARSVGGDLYDFLEDGRRLWFIVADVAGKGMAAALLMAVAQTLFRATALAGLSLSGVMTRMNHELCRNNDRAVFVTAFAGHLDLDSGLLEVANAGHNLPYRLGRDGAVRVLPARNGVALGLLEEATFPITSVQLEPGDGLLVYTDGVCDAVDPKGAAFGADGLERCLARHALQGSERIVQKVIEEVDGFAGTAPQEDDITVVALRYLGRPDDSR